MVLRLRVLTVLNRILRIRIRIKLGLGIGLPVKLCESRFGGLERRSDGTDAVSVC